MKSRRFLSAIMSAVMVFTMFAVLATVVTVAAPITALADPSATATTTAIYVGPSTRYSNSVPSGIFLPLVRTGTYSDGTIAQITAKVKMLNGTKPYVQMARAVSATSGNAGMISIYQASGISSNWNGNDASTVSNGTFTCSVKFKDIPGASNCFYSDTWNGSTQTRRSDIPGRSDPIWGGIYIGNGVINDDSSMTSDSDLSMEFIITDISVKITTLSGGSGGAVGD
ncbi:MAG: hypothetical protein IKZ47_06140, partial [Clostridia bacterium]|nr:hypothetical protein [Clostridia bacterium]